MTTQYRTRASYRDQVLDPDMVVEAEPVEEDGIQYMKVTFPKGAVVVMDDGNTFPASPVWQEVDYFNERHEPVPESKNRARPKS